MTQRLSCQTSAILYLLSSRPGAVNHLLLQVQSRDITPCDTFSLQQKLKNLVVFKYNEFTVNVPSLCLSALLAIQKVGGENLKLLPSYTCRCETTKSSLPPSFLSCMMYPPGDSCGADYHMIQPGSYFNLLHQTCSKCRLRSSFTSLHLRWPQNSLGMLNRLYLSRDKDTCNMLLWTCSQEFYEVILNIYLLTMDLVTTCTVACVKGNTYDLL